MTLKIERSAHQGFTLLTLSGRLDEEHLSELRALLEVEATLTRVLLDLEEIRLADREAVRFLKRCQQIGVELKNCPAYIRDWMEKEAGE